MLNINLVLIALAAIIVLSFWVFVFIVFYHLVRFGIGTQPKILSAVFMFGSFALFFLSIFLFSNIDWNYLYGQMAVFFNSSSFISI